MKPEPYSAAFAAPAPVAALKRCFASSPLNNDHKKALKNASPEPTALTNCTLGVADLKTPSADTEKAPFPPQVTSTYSTPVPRMDCAAAMISFGAASFLPIMDESS